MDRFSFWIFWGFGAEFILAERERERDVLMVGRGRERIVMWCSVIVRCRRVLLGGFKLMGRLGRDRVGR